MSVFCSQKLQDISFSASNISCSEYFHFEKRFLTVNGRPGRKVEGCYLMFFLIETVTTKLNGSIKVGKELAKRPVLV